MADIYDSLAAEMAGRQPVTPATQGADPYDVAAEDIARRRDNQLTGVLNAVTKTNPDKAATINTLSRRTGVPVPVVERNEEQVASMQRLKELREAMAVSPFLQDKMLDPNFAKVAHDDGQGLSTVERLIRAPWKMTQAIAAGMVPSVASGAFGLLAAPFELASQFVGQPLAGKLLPQDPFRGPGASFRAMSANLSDYSKRVADLDPEAGILERGVTSGLQSLGQNIPALVAAVYTGNPNLAIGGLSALVTGQEYTKAQDKLNNPLRSLAYGLGQGMVEAVTEKWAWVKLIGDLKVGAPLFKMLLNNAAREVPGEQAATLLQDLNEWGTLTPEKPFSDYIKERPSAALETLIATLVAGGGSVVLSKAMEREGMVARSAEEAQRVADGLNQLLAAAATSKLHERSPETFRDFVNAASEDSDLPAVWVNAQVLQQTLEQSGIDVATRMPETVAQMEEALAMNRDVRVPTGELATLAGTGVEAALIPELRTDQNAPTLTETSEFYQSLAADTEKQAAEIMAQSEQRDALRDSATKVEQALLAQFAAANRFTNDVNTAYARLASSFYTVQAARLNMTPEALYAKYPLQIRASSVQGDVQMDQSDDVVNHGKALIESIMAKPEFQAELAATQKERGDIAAFRNELMANVRARVEYAAMLARHHTWRHNVGDVIMNTDTGNTFRIVGRSFTQHGSVKKGFMGPTYIIEGGAQGEEGSYRSTAYEEKFTDAYKVIGQDDSPPMTFEQPLSTRVPSGKNAADAMFGPPLVIGLDAVKADNTFFKKIVSAVTSYVNFPAVVKVRNANARAEIFIDHAVDNLLWLYDQVPEATRERSKQWYVGGRAIVDRWSDKYGLTDVQAAGVIAVLSPRMDWFKNVSLAERVLDIMAQHQDTPWDAAMTETAKRIYAKPNDAAKAALLVGRTLAEVNDNHGKAMWVRAYDEAHNTRNYRLITPEGTFGDWARNQDGETKSQIAPQSLAMFAKAISVITDGSLENVSKQLGGAHKVRNFYNNIVDPQNAEHVTVDTHAVAAALLRPLALSDIEVVHNFGTISSSEYGLSGTYGIYAEAYRRAAAQRGVLAREMQSVTWEAVRGLFTSDFKNEKNNKQINSAWERYRKGEQTLDETREQIVRFAGGINAPQWERSAGGTSESTTSTYTSELPDGSVSGGTTTGQRRGAGGDTSGSRRSATLDLFQSGLQPGGASGDGGVAAAQAEAKRLAQGATKLVGLPDKPMLLDGEWYVPGPVGAAQAAARDYMANTGRPYIPPRFYARLNVAEQERLAKAYDEMPHTPNDPETKAAYQAMIDETVAMWQFVKASGLKIEFIDISKGDPYLASPRLAIRDITDNNHFWVFPTHAAHGDVESQWAASDNPWLAESNEEIGGRKATYNELFRVVHDFFGHLQHGNGFRREGEINAYRCHYSMYSPLARRALTVESSAQNAWINYGPHGEANRNAKAADTVFAPQKIGLLPAWAEAGAQEPEQDVLVNIGLAVGTEGERITPEDVRQALDAIGVKIITSAVHESSTEPTVVAALSRELSPDEATRVSAALRQEAIVQLVGDKGEIHGPGAEGWRPFKPEFFLKLDGAPLVGGIANLDLPAHGESAAGGIDVVGVHFSPATRQSLSSNAYGRGAKGAERARVMASRDARIKQRVHFYVNTGEGVFPEENVGAIAHGVVLRGLYDVDSDPLRIGADESKILDAGFNGYFTRQFGKQGAAVLLGEREVNVAPLGIKKDANAMVKGVVPPAPQLSDTRVLVRDFVTDSRLPGGKMLPAEWLSTMEKSAPDLLARVPREAFVGEQPVYRDEIARVFQQNAQRAALIEELKKDPDVFWHGTPSGDLRGSHYGLHLGTYEAAKQALEARIGKPLEGEWDGTREYGKTMLAPYMVGNETGIEARLPSGNASYSDGTKVALDSKPNIVPFRVKGRMTNSRSTPHDDWKANGYMSAAKKRGTAKSGYFYKNISEDEGSISIVVPDGAHLERLDTWQAYQPARGQISMAADITSSPSTITLLQNADLSTFLHEMGHFQLEVLAHIASQPNPPQEIVDDLNAIFKWFGVTGIAEWQAMTLEEKRPHHEKFARGFESYLFEGKSPSQQLNGVFARFRAWMLNVYKELKNLDVTLTDEVRSVFNRMLAVNEDILAAEQARAYTPLFASAKAMGATETEFAAYQELGRDATQDAVDNLQTRSLRDMQWTVNTRNRTIRKMQKDAAEKRKAVRAEVKADVEQQPVYQAYNFLSRGVLLNEDGTTTQAVGAKLSLDALREMYGDGPAVPWRYFNTGKHGLVSADAEGSLHPDTVAEMFGYGAGNGDALVRALLAADPQREVIEGITDQRMLERYGDLSDQQSIERAANQAVHNEARGRFIATELRALSDTLNAREDTGRTDKKGRKITSAVLPRAAREFAETLIARKKIREVRPGQYEAAEARAGKAAERALGKNLVEAATEKRNQLVNHYAARAAHQALEDVEKGVAYLKRVAESESIDIAYREQIQALLERFDLRRTTAAQAAKRKSLTEWVEDQRAQGFEPVIDPALLNEAQRTPYQDMSVEDFRGLVDAARNIAHLGRLKKRLLNARDKREFDAIVAEAATSIHDNAKRTVNQPVGQTRWTKAKETSNKWFAFHRKFSNIIREMDGWSDNGVLWRLFSRGMNDAAAREAVMREDATKKLHALLKPVIAKGRLSKRYEVWPGMSLSREERIMVVLNMGNDGNKQRLLDGYAWTPDQAQMIVDSLSKEDMDFVQSVWDFVGSYRAEIGAQQKRLTGVEPEWIEPTPVMTPHGEYKGGYIPVKYDASRSTRSLSDEAASGIMDQWRGARGAAKTRDSFTKERANKVVDRGLRLDFGVITQHVTEVTHRLAWQEYLIDAQRLLRAKPIDQAIRERYGHEILETLRDTITDIAAGELPAQNPLEGAINYIRTGATIAGLGWRVTTSLLQPIGLTQSMVRIGPKWVGKGIAEWLGDAAKMESTTKRIFDKSEFMRLRAKTMQRELSEIRNVVSGRQSAIEASYFYMIQKMQLVADIPTWLGQYHKSVEAGLDEEASIAQADQAVLDAQGGGQIKDLAGVQRGSPALKLFTNFYSFFNTTYNLTKESVGRTDFKNPLSVGRLAVDFLLLYSVPAALGTLMKEALSDDDDEDKLVRQLIADQLGYMFGTMVFVREAAGIFRSLSGLTGDYQGPAAVRLFGELQKLGKQIQQGELDEGLLKQINAVGGLLFHYPAGQLNATLDGIVSLADGRTNHPGALLVGSKQQ